jgi:hypothetical protein
MRSGAHETDSEHRRGDKLADIAGRRWPPNQGRDLAVRLVLPSQELGEPLDIVVCQLPASWSVPQ